MRKILSALFILSSCCAYSQFTYDYLKAADKYFARGDYYSAAQYYEKYFNMGSRSKSSGPSYNPYTIASKTQKGGGGGPVSSRQQALYNLAESYRLLHYPEKAEPHYKEILNFDRSSFPLAEYHYGTVLRALEKFEEAQTAFANFLAQHSDKDQYTEAAEREVASLRFIQQQMGRKDLSLYTIKKFDSVLNPGGANYAPVWLDDRTILFTSSRDDKSVAPANKNDNRFYQASYSGGTISELQKTSLAQTPEIQQAAAAISPDGQRLYFTRWSSGNGKKTAYIFTSSKANSTWSDPVKLDGINGDSFSTQQPCVMPDGKQLLFASNRPGGKGGFDLYMADLDASGMVKSIKPMDDKINTSGDEQAPYFHAPSSTLVFSSNGRTGMGGYDFYYSKWQGGTCTDPVNFGHPVNSVKDDLYFASRGTAKNILEDVLFSSDRSAACCLELFSLRKEKPLRQVSGYVVRCDNSKPLQEVSIQIVDTINNRVVATRTTNTDGSYSFTLEDYQPLKAVAKMDGFADNFLHFNAPADEMVNLLKNPDICLTKLFPPPVGIVEELENIYYEYDKYELLPSSYPSLDRLAQNLISNPNVVIELAGHTDGNGTDEYNNKLSQQRARSCVDYLIGKGVSSKQLLPKGYGKTVPLAPNTNPDGSDNPEGRAKNRRTEFKVLQK